MKKIVVVGVSCSGKTTLGLKMAKILNSNPVDIDEIHWKPGWVSTPAKDLLLKVKKALDCNKWIVSGNYSSLQNFIFSEADTIIWLDYSPLVVARRALG
jgi:adenylate kinase family enzyme